MLIFICILIALIVLPAPFFVFFALVAITVINPLVGISVAIAVVLLWSAK